MMLKEFHDLLTNEMDDIQADFDTTSNADKFAIWIGSQLFGLEKRKIIDNLLLYSDELSGTAVFAYFEDDTDKANVIICWYQGCVEAERTGIERIRTLKSLGEKIIKSEENTSKEFKQEVDDRGIGVDFTIYIVTNAELSSDARAFVQNQSVQLLSGNDLTDKYVRMQNPLRVETPEKLEFTVPNTQTFDGPQVFYEDVERGISTLVCALPLNLVSEWVSRFKNGLFAENLRYRLREYDKKALELEEKIQETILAKPELMFVQNNGITITCASIQREDTQQEVRVTLHFPQIVNGCQTSWAIRNAVEKAKAERDQAPHGFVFAKIIQTQDPRLTQQITSASNRQNAIQPRDEWVKDRRQITISTQLAKHIPNLGIYWDYRRGGWSNILYNEQGDLYRIKGQRGSIRELKNGEAGQIILAMAGAVHEAKNKGGKIFESESLYKIAFGYDLDINERFGSLASQALLSSGGDDALNTYLNDLLFGFAVYQHATAAFKWLYADRERRLKAELDKVIGEQKGKELQRATEVIASREFVKFWAFDIVRSVHLIVEKWCERGKNRKQLREALVNDLTISTNLDSLFLSKAKRPKWFNMESDLNYPETLDSENPSSELRLLGIWFSSLEELGADVISEIKERDPVSMRTLIISRRTTHDKLIQHLTETVLNTAKLPRMFPYTV